MGKTVVHQMIIDRKINTLADVAWWVEECKDNGVSGSQKVSPMKLSEGRLSVTVNVDA